MKKRIAVMAAVVLLALAALPGTGMAEGLTFYDGWDVMDNNRVFYEIFVGSFSDSDGDGTGDLRGIINRMDYLNDGDPASGKSLGVEGIWLTPIFKSPSYHKYDVVDYYTIDPAFGTMDDLRELVAVCHERNVKVILDLALNHTSSQHIWYRRFLNSHTMNNPAGPCYDYYSYIGPDDKAPAGRTFMKEYSARIQVESNFSSSMPELNFDSEAVRQEVLKIAKFYLELGVDGFRFDAAKYLYLNEHDKNLEFWTWYIGELKAINPDVYTVAEVWDGEGITNRYASAVNCFHFATSQAEGLIAETAKAGDVNRLTSAMQKYIDTLHGINPEAMKIDFIANHDTDRAAGYLTMASGRAAVAASLYILSPGSPFIYYGEEIGLRGSRGGANTDANRRLAMLWGDGDTVQDPPGSTYTSQTTYSVQDLDGMKSSLLNHYRKLTAIRKANPEIARGEYTALSFSDTKAGGFLCEWNGSTAGVFHNTTERVQKLELQDAGVDFRKISAWISADPLDGGASLDGTVLTLGPLTSAVLRTEED